jgi:hypothetical protein
MALPKSISPNFLLQYSLMKAISHKVNHYYQPTNDSCGYTALATLLSHYDIVMKPEELLSEIPEAKPEGEEAYGSITSQLATWSIGQGFKCELTTFDFLIIDLSWAKLKNNKGIIQRLEAVKEKRNVPSMGKGWSKVYIEEYINYLEANGKINIQPYVRAESLYEMLKSAPVYINVCTKPLYNNGRTRYTGLRQGVDDDVDGSVGTHSVVIYGNNESGNFLLADPWNGMTEVTPESLIAAVTAAEIECDAMCFQLFR